MRWFDVPWKRHLLTLAALVALTLVAAHPSMFGAMPATDDGLLHLYRLVGLDHAIQHGLIWPRYLPGMAYGYGIPVFNYYAPVSLYPMEALHLLGISFLDSFLLGMILYTFLGVAGAYLLGKAWGGPLAGIVTSAAFTYAPYTILDWPRRGAIAEYLALVLIVWMLWAFYYVAQSGRRRYVIAAVAFFALTIMAHNISGLWAAGLLIPYSVVLWWTAPDPRRAFVRLGLTYLVGIGLSAVYWIPALFEVDAVQINRAFTNIGNFSFRVYFRTLGEIFGLPRTTDLTQLGTPYPRSVGWPQLALTLLAGALLFWRGEHRSASHRAHAELRHFLILTTLLVPVLVFMMTNASAPLWETIPLLPYFQIPWRMLGPISILLAVGAGAGTLLVARRLPGGFWRMLWTGFVLLLIIGYSLPWLYGVYLPEPTATSIIDAQNYERLTKHVGGTSGGEYLPIDVDAWPDPDRLTGLYAQSDVIPRLQPNDDVSVGRMDWGLLFTDLDLTARTATTLTFDWLYWPGFRVTVDGQPAPITPSRPNGFVTVDVPAGGHKVTVSFGLTPLRRWATIGSAVALGLLILSLILLPIWRKEDRPQSADVIDWPQIAPLFLAAIVAGLAVFGVKVLLLDNINSPVKADRFASGLEGGLEVPVQANIGGEVTLLGFDRPPATVRSGDTFDFTVYWIPSGDAIPVDLSTTYVIRDVEDQVIQQKLVFSPGGITTTTWVPGFYVRESVQLALPPGTTPGVYSVQAGIYSHEMGRNLDVLDEAGSPIGVLADLGTIQVVRPRRAAALTTLPIPAEPDTRITDNLRLVAVSDLPAEASVGQELGVIWYWRVLSDMHVGRRARLIWMDDQGQIAGATPPVALAVSFPTEAWRERDLWRGVHLLYVPGALEAGKYRVAVQLLDGNQPVGEQVPIGAMDVSTPERTFSLPEDVQVRAGVGWTTGIALLGYDLPRTEIGHNDGLRVTFYWQPGEQLPESLTVFVHLYSDDGVIVAQNDQIPAGGSRPTTGWAPGEVVIDRHQLYIGEDVPPGTYHLRVGWYNALAGEQFHTRDGMDFWPLPGEITVKGS